MSAIQHAITTINATIPPQLLNIAFVPQDMYGFQTSTKECYLESNVIRNRVLRDINITGGQVTDLPVYKAVRTAYNSNNAFYQFSDSDFNGNTLVSVLDFVYGDSRSYGNDTGTIGSTEIAALQSGGCGSNGCGITGTSEPPYGHHSGSSIQNAANQFRQANEKYIPFGISKVKLIGKNAIAIQDVSSVLDGWFRVLVSHDHELTDIQPRSWLAFSELCVLATKSYIYNLLILGQSYSETINGYTVDRIRDVYSEYQGSEEEYQTKILEWGAVAFNNDPKRVSEFLGLQINPGAL